MARKKQTMTSEEILHQMYPDLRTSDDDVQEQQQQQAAQTDAQKMAALEAQIAILTQQVSRPAPTATPTPTQRQQRQAPTPPVTNYAQAPDPVVNPIGYAEFMRQEVARQVAYEKELYNYQQTEAQAATARTTHVWNDFSDQFGAYAKDEEKVEIAATRVLQKAAAAGYDADTYMNQNRATFFAETVREYDKFFGKPAIGGEDDDNDDDGAGDDDDNRAQVFGGSAAGPKGPAAQAPKAPQKFGELGQSIREWQEKTGFIR